MMVSRVTLAFNMFLMAAVGIMCGCFLCVIISPSLNVQAVYACTGAAGGLILIAFICLFAAFIFRKKEICHAGWVE